MIVLLTSGDDVPDSVGKLNKDRSLQRREEFKAKEIDPCKE